MVSIHGSLHPNTQGRTLGPHRLCVHHLQLCIVICVALDSLFFLLMTVLARSCGLISASARYVASWSTHAYVLLLRSGPEHLHTCTY